MEYECRSGKEPIKGVFQTYILYLNITISFCNYDAIYMHFLKAICIPHADGKQGWNCTVYHVPLCSQQKESVVGSTPWRTQDFRCTGWNESQAVAVRAILCLSWRFREHKDQKDMFIRFIEESKNNGMPSLSNFFFSVIVVSAYLLLFSLHT